MDPLQQLKQLKKDLEKINAQMDADIELVCDIFDDAILKIKDINKGDTDTYRCEIDLLTDDDKSV